MRLPRYIAVNALIFFATSIYACSWFPSHSGNVLLYRIMPLDESDYGHYATSWESDYKLHQVDYKAENLKLWQQQTSSDISKSDIEHIVYTTEASFLKDNKNILEKTSLKHNSFAKWIVDNKRMDILDFLILAKQSEDVRSSMNDPWYYHVEGNSHYRMLERIVEKCREYQSGSLLGRYALQMVRALCSLRQYEDCASYWDSIKRKLDDDVIKKMAELRAAEALYKTGRKEEALNIYAKHGDVSSIRAINEGQIDNELEFVYEHAPNSPYLEEELQKWLIYYGDDSTEQCFKNALKHYWDVDKLNSIIKVAHKVVREKKTKKMAMWYYVLAALYDTQGKSYKAKGYLEQGFKYPQDAFLKDSYHVLHMWLDAKTTKYNQCYERRLLSDLRWLDHKIQQNVTPDVVKKISEPKGKVAGPLEHNYVYTDNAYGLYWGYQDRSNIFYWNDILRRLLLRVVCPRMHMANNYVREIQLANMAENSLVKSNCYSSEMFGIIDRLSYKNTRDYFSRIYYPKDQLDRFLNSRGRIDKNYWYDIMGTKCLRERRYTKAIVYLKQVPLSFQKHINVYKSMNKDPFSYNMERFMNDTLSADNYKLRFAEEMNRFDNTMRYNRNPDKRAQAKIQYALGLRNSVHRCWYLTRYSSNSENDYNRGALPEIPYPTDTTIYRHREYLRLSERLINEAISEFRDKELAAQELRKFMRYQRIMDSYGDTETANDIKRHCDKWRDYAIVVGRQRSKQDS